MYVNIHTENVYVVCMGCDRLTHMITTETEQVVAACVLATRTREAGYGLVQELKSLRET